MPVYTPPALNAVDFALSVQPAHSVAPYVMALTSYTTPALNAVDFALSVYTQPVYNTIDFELLGGGGTNWTLNLSDTVTLSENLVKGVGKGLSDIVTLSENILKSSGLYKSDTVTLSDIVTGGTGGDTPQFILAYRWYWVKIYIARLEGRNVYRIKIFD